MISGYEILVQNNYLHLKVQNFQMNFIERLNSKKIYFKLKYCEIRKGMEKKKYLNTFMYILRRVI